MFHHNAALTLLALLLGAGWQQVYAAESYDNCTGYVDSLPATISTQGTWCLRGDLSTAVSTGTAITIATNNVTLDCNDFKIGGLPVGANTGAVGVQASGRLNATVRNCNIRGFLYGVKLQGAGHVVEDSRFDGNTAIGIWADGDGTVVRRNRVLDTGGSTLYSTAIGIATNSSADIADNTVAGVASMHSSGAGTNYGISMTSGSANGNVVRGVVMEQGGWGIVSNGAAVLSDNDVMGTNQSGAVGIGCGSEQGLVINNIVARFTTGIQGCTQGNGNDVSL